MVTIIEMGGEINSYHKQRSVCFKKDVQALGFTFPSLLSAYEQNLAYLLDAEIWTK